ncbi:hypothetical protein ABMA70_00885 [Halobacteriovorax sp. XZX-3]|uniref:hypothetical protein n=1 Tax=unclassified Halobacteriovorax TaxID=2639665 RepID=UPI0037171295
MKILNLSILILLISILTAKVYAADGLVAINGESLPAGDLYSIEYGPIDSEQAYELQAEGVDLSTLSPVLSNLWNGANNFSDYKDDLNLPINDFETLNFSGVISSPAGVLRFNAQNGEGNFQVHLSKTLHTILLRKNMLRRLGYVVPASKYLKNIRINFKDEKQKDYFKDVELVIKLGASYKNWLVEEGSDFLVLKDIFVRQPKEDDFYDVALTSINDTKDLRTLRSLIVVYSLLNLEESINKYSFNFLKIKNDHLLFEYPSSTDFSATYDDVKWISRLIGDLNRHEITQVVKQSHYPAVVEKLLVEKIIGRRNNLISTLKLNAPLIEYSKDIKDPLVKDGFLIPHEFEGYAGQFSFGASKSPMDDIPAFLFSEAQSSTFKWITGKISEGLSAFDLSKAKVKWLQEDFLANKDYAINYFAEHGEFPPLPFSSWKSPVVRGNIIFGRDIVVGQSLGTDNFVQLADTIGFTTNLGLFIGLERFISQTTGGSVFPNIGINTSYTHVRPVQDLRVAVKTPYKNMLVGKTLRNIEEKLKQSINISDLDNETRREDLHAIYNEISQQFGVGESIIISTSVVPDVTLSLNAPLFGVANGYGSISTKYKELSRIHITRKSKYMFQVYYDEANVSEVRARGGLSYLIPIIMSEAAAIKSKLDLKFYEINMDPEQEDLEFSKNAVKFLSILRDRSNEAMGPEDIQVYNHSKDSTFNLNLLFFVSRTLKSITELFVKIKDQVNIKLISSTYGEMDGIAAGKFLKNIASYHLKKFINNLEVSFDKSYIPMIEEAKHYYQNPGKELFGAATTYETKFESKLSDINAKASFDNMNELYLHYRKTHEKAIMKEKTIKKYLKKENEAFNLDFYTPSDANDAGDMHFVRLESKIHFFDKSVKKILSITSRDLDKISQKMKVRNCFRGGNRDNDNSGRTISEQLRCGDLDPIKSKLYWCNKYLNKAKTEKGLKCLAHVGHYFAKYVDARTLLEFFGEDNMYIESQLSGYRVGSELMTKPIVGNSYGKINSRNFGGPINKLVTVLGMIKAEVLGLWYRETLK